MCSRLQKLWKREKNEGDLWRRVSRDLWTIRKNKRQWNLHASSLLGKFVTIFNADMAMIHSLKCLVSFYKLMTYLPIKLNSSIFELTLILWFSENIREIDAESKVKWQWGFWGICEKPFISSVCEYENRYILHMFYIYANV